MADVGRIGVFGRSGCGKTTLVRELLRGRDRVVIFDPLDEYTGHRCRTVREVLAALRQRWGERRWVVRYVPPAGAEPRALHLLSLVLARAQAPYRAGQDRRVLTLAVDELNLSYPVHALPADCQGIAELCSRGRHYGIELIGVSQRVAEVNARFRGNLTEGWYGAQPDHTSRRAVLDAIGPEHRQVLAALPPYRWIQVRDGRVCATAAQTSCGPRRRRV